MMNQTERYILLAVGSVVSIGITSVICYLALTATDTAERSILFGALIGTAGFGGGAIFTLLGLQHRQGTGPGSTVTVPNPPNDPVIVSTGDQPPPEPRRDDA